MNISHMEIHLIERLYRNIVGEKTLSHVFIFKFKKNDFFLKSAGRGPFNMHWWGTMLGCLIFIHSHMYEELINT